ncbi:MAG: tyrosine--tRNA ligase [Bacillota bacterium]
MQNTEEVVSEEELLEKLRTSLKEERPLRVKLGLDPSAPDIHLGHAVVLRKLRQFQDLGHEVTCLIGDFTGRVGDPSGVSQTRRQLTEGEVRENAQTYREQIFKILDPDKTVMDFNSRWLGAMTFADVVELASNVTVARMLERNDFSERYSSDRPIYVHEFFYPLMQGYDSVALESDVELGGTDQKFNLLMARTIQRAYGIEPEIAMTMPIIEGTDGLRKMSKSLDNYIGITEEPDEMFGKVMSLPDGLICRYFRLLTDRDPVEIRRLEESLNEGEVNPRDVKEDLGLTIVSAYWGEEPAREAASNFRRVFSAGGLPEDMEDLDTSKLLEEDGTIWIVALICAADFASSNSEARRLVEQGAVSLDGERVVDPHARIRPSSGQILRVGRRRFCRLV